MADNTNPQANIEQARDLLSPYLDGEVTTEERLLIEQVLESSPELRWELETLRQTATQVAALPYMPAPRPFTLSEADVQAVSPAPRRFFRLPVWFGGLAAAAVALLCILAAGAFFLSGSLGGRSAPGEIAMQAAEEAPAEEEEIAAEEAVEEADLAAPDEAPAAAMSAAEAQPTVTDFAAEAEVVQEAAPAEEVIVEEAEEAAAEEAAEAELSVAPAEEPLLDEEVAPAEGAGVAEAPAPVEEEADTAEEASAESETLEGVGGGISSAEPTEADTTAQSEVAKESGAFPTALPLPSATPAPTFTPMATDVASATGTAEAVEQRAMTEEAPAEPQQEKSAALEAQPTSIAAASPTPTATPQPSPTTIEQFAATSPPPATTIATEAVASTPTPADTGGILTTALARVIVLGVITMSVLLTIGLVIWFIMRRRT